jgi:metallo-beta-lactamase family protein
LRYGPPAIDEEAEVDTGTNAFPRLRFHGASGCVTGSCYLIEHGAARVLVDCGMFQGSKTEKELNYRPFPFPVDSLDAVLLTHAHIDHSGLLPKLVKAGYRGPIWATPATRDLCSVMLPDSGHVQEMEVENLNRRNLRRGRPPVTPIYTAEEGAATVDAFRAVRYHEWFDVAAGVRARFWNAGHLLGSGSIEVELSGRGKPLRILFSGDIGPDNKLLHPDPEAPADFDFALCESTYGNVDRVETTDELRRKFLADVVRKAAKAGGALLIPSFAVERTQEVLIDLVHLMDRAEVPQATVYVDSPLATKATAIFAAHAGDIEGGAEAAKAFASRRVKFTESAEQSKALDRLREFHVVIAGSGMCDAGRIRFRLKNWLWREEATVLMVGFQAQGTLGRILLDGASTVRIQGDDIKVRARILSMDHYSGHADGPELVAWVRERLPIAHQVFLVHGEDPAFAGFRGRLAGVLRSDQVVVPSIDQTYELTPSGARVIETGVAPRIRPQSPGHLDWNNDLSKLQLDINDAIRGAGDDKARAVVIRRLRRALAAEREEG